MISVGLDHVAMSFPPGTLTDDFRAEVREFYGEHLGWVEIDELELADRCTLAAGGATYVNLREREDAMVCHGYEHIGVRVRSAADVDVLHEALGASDRAVEVGELHRGDDGFRSFRFRYLFPMAVEVRYVPT